MEQAVSQLISGMDEMSTYVQQMQQDIGNLVSRMGELEKALQEISMKNSAIEKGLNAPSGFEGGAPPAGAAPAAPPEAAPAPSPMGGMMG